MKHRVGADEVSVFVLKFWTLPQFPIQSPLFTSALAT